MFQVVLTDIQWAGQRKNLPSRWTYDVDDAGEAAWEAALNNNCRGNRFEFRRLLKDTFQAEAERQYDCEIAKCKIVVRRA